MLVLIEMPPAVGCGMAKVMLMLMTLQRQLKRRYLCIRRG